MFNKVLTYLLICSELHNKRFGRLARLKVSRFYRNRLISTIGYRLCPSVRPSVRLSVFLSNLWSTPKRFNITKCLLNRTIERC